MRIQDLTQLMINAGIEPNEAKKEIKMLLEHFCNFNEKDFKPEYQMVYYNYEDGWIFFLDDTEAIESLPEYCWKILEKTESMDFSSTDLVKKEKTDN